MSELRPTVLVVDDEPAVRAITRRGLMLCGFDVLLAADGLSAIRVLQATDHPPVRLVITDIRMPGMSGDDLGRLLHHTQPSLPVLYMSGYSMPELGFLPADDMRRCWLEKPFTMHELAEKVRGLLSADTRLIGA
jgi:two-component system cell cycle sensor histidine kinase/response regulator CckA